MAKFVNDNNMDELLNRVKNNAIRIVLCNGQPANYNEAQTNKGSTVAGGGTARRLGQKTISSTTFTGPANGDTSGRKVTKDQETSLSIDVTSTGANHVALVTSSTHSTSIGNELTLVTTISSPQDVTSGNTATINAFDLEVNDPS